MIIVICILGALGLFAVYRSKNKSKPKVPKQNSGNSSGWMIGGNSVGMPKRPTLQGAGWFLDFPGPGKKVDYVQNFSPPSLVGATALVMKYKVEGSGIAPSDGRGSPRVCVGIQRKGDDWDGDPDRWYLQGRPVIKPGEFTLTVPLNASAMNDVNGKTGNTKAFDATVRELDNIFVCFGSDGAAGHGVYTTERATFTLLALEIVR